MISGCTCSADMVFSFPGWLWGFGGNRGKVVPLYGFINGTIDKSIQSFSHTVGMCF